MEDKIYTGGDLRIALKAAGYPMSTASTPIKRLEEEGILPKPRWGKINNNKQGRIYNREEFEEVVFKIIEYKTRYMVTKTDIGKMLIRVGERMVKDGK